MLAYDLTTWQGVARALEAHLQSEALADGVNNHWVRTVDLPEGVHLTPVALDEHLVHFCIGQGLSEGTLIRVLIQTGQRDPLIPVLIAKSLSGPRRAIPDLIAIQDWVAATHFA